MESGCTGPFAMYERRSAMISLAGTVLVGTGLALGGCVEGDDRQGEVTANEDLMREHGVLRRILIIYREVAARLITDGAQVNARALAGAAKLFQEFGERYHEQLLE